MVLLPVSHWYLPSRKKMKFSLSLDCIGAASPFIFPSPRSLTCCRLVLLFLEVVCFVFPSERAGETALPSQSPLKTCLALIGRGGKRFSCLSLTLFYFEAIKHHSPGFVCLSNLGSQQREYDETGI